MRLWEFRQKFDTLLKTYIQTQKNNLWPHCYDKKLQDIINYIDIFHQWGKRIRPYLIYALYTAYGWVWEDIRWIWITMELIHLFALIHDDIIDKGETRHGSATYHKYISWLYNDQHIGMSQWLLVWDLLYTWALKKLIQTTNNKDIQWYFLELLEEVVMWEIIDVHLSATPLVDDITHIHRKDTIKSGNYTFTRPMIIGYMLAWWKDIPVWLAQLGNALWTAFQMRDDLLDVIQPKANKTRFSDLQEGNQTVLLYETLQHVSQEQKNAIIACRGQSLTQQQQKNILNIMTESWAIERTKQHIDSYLDQAVHILETLDFSDIQIKEPIKEIIDFLRV